MSVITIFHGSSVEIRKPQKNRGKKYNDYGQGFYCTKHRDLAAQWACKLQEDGIVNEYSLDLAGLKVLNLDENYNILNWLAILVENREITGDMAIINAKYVMDNYLIDYKNYDVIIGYRADDAYFRFVREFLTNVTGIKVLDEAMYLGEQGLQVFIQSELAFERLHFVRSYEVDQEEYYIIGQRTVDKAEQEYDKLKLKYEMEDVYIRDLKGGKANAYVIPKIQIK